MVGTYLKMLSLRPLDEIDDVLAAADGAPERRPAQRALADEMTTLVHGATAAAAARRGRRGAVRRPIRPARRRRRLRPLPPRSPSSRCPAVLDGVRVHEMLVQAGIAKSNSEVSRLLGARCGASRKSGARRGRPAGDVRPAQGAVLAAPQGQAGLRRRKMFDGRLTLPSLVDSVATRLARPLRFARPGTNRGFRLLRAALRQRHRACLGSLKTEEKTERQCGQRWHRPDFGCELDAVLSIQKSPGSQPGAQIKKSDGR